MGLRAAPKDDSGISLAELVYGQELRLPGQPTLSTAPVAKGAATPPAVRPALPTRLTGDLNQMGRIPAQLEGATHVYVLNGAKPSPLSPPYSGSLCGAAAWPEVLRHLHRRQIGDYFCGPPQVAQGPRSPGAGGAAGSRPPEAGIGQILFR
jgi:hypothetical protein